MVARDGVSPTRARSGRWAPAVETPPADASPADGAPVEAWALGACDADVEARVVVDARSRVFVAGAARVPPRSEAPQGDGVTAFVARLDP